MHSFTPYIAMVVTVPVALLLSLIYKSLVKEPKRKDGVYYAILVVSYLISYKVLDNLL